MCAPQCTYFFVFRQEGMETGSEGEVTNNDFPLRKTGKCSRTPTPPLLQISSRVSFFSLGAEPAEGPPEAAGDGAPLQSAQQTPPAAVAQEEAAQLVSAAERVAALLSGTAEGAESALRVGRVPEARPLQQSLHAEHLARRTPRALSRPVGGGGQGRLHRQTRDAPHWSDATR